MRCNETKSPKSQLLILLIKMNKLFDLPVIRVVAHSTADSLLFALNAASAARCEIENILHPELSENRAVQFIV